MKTVRFSQVVDKCGKPEIYLTLSAPTKDRHLQSAIKAHKVMTVRQDNAGSKVDRGEIGFEEGPERQYLIFPRSLQRFVGRKVVGIKYGLIAEPEISKSQLAPPVREKKRSKPKSTTSKALAETLSSRDVETRDLPDTDSDRSREGRNGDSKQGSASHKRKSAGTARTQTKQKARPKDRPKDSDGREITALKKVVRKAMSELEKGKAVAAFNLLKQISDA